MSETKINLDYQVDNTQFDNKVSTVVTSGSSSADVVNTAGDTMTGELSLPSLNFTTVYNGDEFKIYSTYDGVQTKGIISFGKSTEDRVIIAYDDGNTLSEIVIIDGSKIINFDASQFKTTTINQEHSANDYTITASKIVLSDSVNEIKLEQNDLSLNVNNIIMVSADTSQENTSHKLITYNSDLNIMAATDSLISVDSNRNGTVDINIFDIIVRDKISFKKDGEDILKIHQNGKLEIPTVLPVGTVLMYNGSGIANVATRDVEIGADPNDTIKMPGWFVCNGKNGTPNLLNKFIRSESASGNTGGSDDAVVVRHRHGASVSASGTHNHSYVDYYSSDGVHGGTKVDNENEEGDGSGGYRRDDTTSNAGSHTHSISIDYTGVDGTGKNIPAYYSLIFIIRMN